MKGCDHWTIKLGFQNIKGQHFDLDISVEQPLYFQSFLMFDMGFHWLHFSEEKKYSNENFDITLLFVKLFPVLKFLQATFALEKARMY